MSEAMIDIHQLLTTIDTPTLPTTYRALCGYQTEDPKEFRRGKQGTEAITCEKCLDKPGVVRCDGDLKP